MLASWLAKFCKFNILIYLIIVTGKVAVFTKMQSGVQFIKLPPGSILTSVTPSQQFICVTTLPRFPQWYYNDSLLPANMSNTTNTTNSFTNLNATGNYTCAIDKSDNYTVTLTAGLLYNTYRILEVILDHPFSRALLY